MAPASPTLLGGVVLVTGPEEFLAERQVQRARAAVRGIDPEAEVSETSAETLTMATLGELAAPSLFSSTRCVVVRKLEDLPEESAEGLLEYAAAPAEDIALVLVHSGGQKGSGLLTKLRKLPAVTELKSESLKGVRQYADFVTAELRGHQVKVSSDGAEYLVTAVGQDLRSLAAAASQLASDFDGKPITIEMVQTYFAGRAEAKSFAVADHTLAGRRDLALEELRWALERGTAPVLVTSAVAGSLRSLARLSAARRGARDADLVRDIGVPPWKLRDLRNQLRGWDPAGIARAIEVAAQADAEVKGAASDAAYALEKMVLAITAARSDRRDR